MTTRVLRVDRDFVTLPLVDGPSGEARAIVWPGMGARHRSMHHIRLPAGAATVPQRHPSEAVYYVIGGTGTVEDLDAGASHALRAGAFAHITPNSRYRFVAGGAELVCVGGPCPPDSTLYPAR
jgi:quercetin dioxygenase-like cupin family protein